MRLFISAAFVLLAATFHASAQGAVPPDVLKDLAPTGKVRADKIDFSPPYVVIEGTYMVAKDSPMKSVADVDKPGVRIAVGLNSAYDLYLTRSLKSATLVRATIGGGGAGIDLFVKDKLDA